MADIAFWKWWLRREAAAILAVGSLAVILIAIVVYAAIQIKKPSELNEATIVRFGIDSDYEGNSPLVLVRTTDGTLHQLHVHPSSLLGCRRGDRVELIRRGSVTTVNSRSCRPPA